jgi:hypothetical protein
MPHARLSCLLAVAVSTLSLACGDETDPHPPLDLTLETLWPHADGAGWSYEVTSWSGGISMNVYDSRDEVPPVPAFDVIASMVTEDLGATRGDPPVERAHGVFRLEFEGESSTLTGMTGQNLRATEFYEREWSAPRRVAPDESFLSSLAIARPDLRHLFGVPADPRNLRQPFSPLLVHGGVWEQTSRAIVTHSDVDTIPGWEFLEAPIAIGRAFRYQLVRPLADDVYLLARYESAGRFMTTTGIYERTLQVLYIVDYGISDTGDVDGGYYRLFDYGIVVYAPEVGPIFAYERKLVDASLMTSGAGQLTLSLLGTADPDDPYALGLSGAVRLEGTLRDGAGSATGTRSVDSADGVRVVLAREGRNIAEAHSAGGAFRFDDLNAGRYAVKTWVGFSETDAAIVEASAETAVLDEDVQIPDALELRSTGGLRAVPNGFHESVSLRYTLAEDGPARLEIHDLAGNTISVLAFGPQVAGDHVLVWDARSAAPGPYWAVLGHPGGVEAELLFKEE